MASKMQLSVVALDCADPMALAEFYSQMTGWPIEPVEVDWWVQLASPGDVTLAFQLAPDHQSPGWPDGDPPQQLHLDFDVANLDEAEAEALALGAVKADDQPKPQFWRVFLDPAGHPFCLVLKAESTTG